MAETWRMRWFSSIDPKGARVSVTKSFETKEGWLAETASARRVTQDLLNISFNGVIVLNEGKESKVPGNPLALSMAMCQKKNLVNANSYSGFLTGKIKNTSAWRYIVRAGKKRRFRNDPVCGAGRHLLNSGLPVTNSYL